MADLQSCIECGWFCEYPNSHIEFCGGEGCKYICDKYDVWFSEDGELEWKLKVKLVEEHLKKEGIELKPKKEREEKDCIDYDDMMEKHYLEWEEQIQDNNLTCCNVFCKSWWRYDIEKWNNPVCINCCKWLIEDNIKFKKIEVKLIDGEPRKKRVIKKKI